MRLVLSAVISNDFFDRELSFENVCPSSIISLSGGEVRAVMRLRLAFELCPYCEV